LKTEQKHFILKSKAFLPGPQLRVEGAKPYLATIMHPEVFWITFSIF